MQDLWQRFQLEVKANGKKAGLLAALFLFGCIFWIPMAVRAMGGTSTRTSTRRTPPPAAVTAAADAAPEVDTSKFWETLSKSLAEDSMFASADGQALARDPFHVSESMEPLPVLFAEEPKSVVLSIKPEFEPVSLELTGTVVGRTRSVARINGKLYGLGTRLRSGGKAFLLTKIESHRVELASGDQTIELTLARPQLKDVLDRGDDSDVPVQ